MSVAWGIWGIVFILCGLVPRAVPSYLLAAVLIVLLFALPYYLPRLVCGELPTAPSGDKQINSPSAALLLVGLSLGTVLWVSRLAFAPQNLVFALLLLLTAAWALFSAWGRHWWRGLLAYAVSFGAAGLAMPFVSMKMVGPSIGLAMIFAGFVGAAILHQQLKVYYANGKAAH